MGKGCESSEGSQQQRLCRGSRLDDDGPATCPGRLQMFEEEANEVQTLILTVSRLGSISNLDRTADELVRHICALLCSIFTAC